MRRLQVLLLMLCFVVALPAQKKSTVQRKTSTTRTVARKKVIANKKPVKKHKATTKQKAASNQNPVTVQGLKNQRQQLQKQIREQERRLRQTESDVKKRLQNLMVINTEIDDKRRVIDTIRRDITTLDGNIHILNGQLKVLDKELEDRKERFMSSARYLHRNRSVHNRLMFIFSAKNFTQMYRRMRFMREYAVYQRAQGEAVKSMQAQVTEAMEELSNTKKQKDNLLVRGEQEKKALEGKQVEQQNVVNTLQKQQKTIQSLLEQQRKKDEALNAQIDKLIAEEIARAKARAEAERRKKAAEEAAKKRAEELARKKAAAEAAARENARRIKEAREREERAKAEARAAAQKSAREKAAAEKAALEAENARKSMERKAAEEARVHKREVEAVKKKTEEVWTESSVDRKLSSNFEANRGRFPMPITGPYKIVNTFGQNRVEGLKGTTMKDIKGINIKGQPGAKARSIFDGEVSGVGGYAGSMIVIVRHGNYLSVYCNLSSVSVTRGQKVSARQTLGTIGGEGIMQFQLRKLNGALINPSSWLGR